MDATTDRPSSLTLTRAGIERGARDLLPMGLGALLFGLSLGMLAKSLGIPLGVICFMSLSVFAGASQFVVTQLWEYPLPVAALLVTTLVVNARHLLMGASLAPWLRQARKGPAFLSLFFLVDETWGMTVARVREGERDLGYLIGGGLILYLCWNSGTLAGHLLAESLPDPRRFGLENLGTAVFLILLLLQWSGRNSLWTWGAGGGVAILASQVLPGGWYVLLGGLAGSLAGALMERPARETGARRGD